MRNIACGMAVATLAAIVSGHTLAQQPLPPTAAADTTCRQYADAAMAAARNELPPEAAGSSLVGAGLGGGPPSAAEREAYVRQRYNGAYTQCVSARGAPPPGYEPMPGPAPTASQLNQQQLYTAPPYPTYPPRQ